MNAYRELREACASCAPVLGAAFMSGRETAAYFSACGGTSWVGIATASVLFGVLMGMICRFAADTRSRTLPAIYAAKMGRRCGDAVTVVHALMMVMLGAAAVSTAGELGRLMLEIPFPALISASAAFTLAIMLTWRSMRSLAPMGMLSIVVCLVFWAMLAADPRPVNAHIYLKSNDYVSPGSIPAAVFMGAMFASMKAFTAGGIAAARSDGLAPLRFGFFCALITGAASTLSNIAILSAGPELAALNLPGVVLASRCGMAGYNISIYAMWLGCVGMLSCALGSLSGIIGEYTGKLPALLAAIASAALMGCAGLRQIVDVCLPLLGWLGAICLYALALFFERRRPRRKHIPDIQKASVTKDAQAQILG